MMNDEFVGMSRARRDTEEDIVRLNEIQERYVEVLAGETYTQSGGLRLRTGETFCVLGVGCDVTDPDGWDADGKGHWRHRGRDAVPVSGVCTALGLKTVIGEARWTHSGCHVTPREMAQAAQECEAETIAALCRTADPARPMTLAGLNAKAPFGEIAALLGARPDWFFQALQPRRGRSSTADTDHEERRGTS